MAQTICYLGRRGTTASSRQILCHGVCFLKQTPRQALAYRLGRGFAAEAYVRWNIIRKIKERILITFFKHLFHNIALFIKKERKQVIFFFIISLFLSIIGISVPKLFISVKNSFLLPLLFLFIIIVITFVLQAANTILLKRKYLLLYLTQDKENIVSNNMLNWLLYLIRARLKYFFVSFFFGLLFSLPLIILGIIFKTRSLVSLITTLVPFILIITMAVYFYKTMFFEDLILISNDKKPKDIFISSKSIIRNNKKQTRYTLLIFVFQFVFQILLSLFIARFKVIPIGFIFISLINIVFYFVFILALSTIIILFKNKKEGL